MVEPFLSSIGLKTATTVGGFLGALVSLKFIENQTLGQRATTVFAGTVAAAYLAPLIGSWMNASASFEGGMAFLTGVIFMSVMGAILKAAPEIIAAVRKKWIGE